MLAAHVAAGGGAVGVVQQGGGEHNLKVCTFFLRQAACHAVHALDVREVVHRIGVDIPFSGLI